MEVFDVRPYREADEQGWVRCRALSFLGSAYHDDVRADKERYEGPSIELVAHALGEVVGLIDVELEREPGTVELQDGLRDLFPITEGLRPVKLFAHYVGGERDEIRRRFARVHDCVLFERSVG